MARAQPMRQLQRRTDTRKVLLANATNESMRAREMKLRGVSHASMRMACLLQRRCASSDIRV
jgi:hypothetical protein